MGSTQSLQSSVNAVSLQLAADAISRWDSKPKDSLLFDCGRSEVTQYLQAVDKIQKSANCGEFDHIISMAVAQLMREFQTVLTRQTESAICRTSATELSSSITDTTSYQFRYEEAVGYDGPSTEVIDYLRNIAQRMDSCGHLNACIQEYTTARTCFVNAKIRRLRLEELQAGDKKRVLVDELKMKIERWIQAAKVCNKHLFAKEKQLAKRIFGGLGTSSTHEECFLSSVKDATVDLFTFAKDVSSSNQSSERLEVILILYEGLSSLMQDFNALFPSESAKGVRDSTAAIVSRLRDEVRRMLPEFETAVLNEPPMISDSDKGGGVHSSTTYVVKYVNLIVKYRKLLNFVPRPSMTVGGKRLLDGELQNPQSLSPLALHLILIIAALQLNLENKSKCFKDASLGHLFMMNNAHYIVQKIKESKQLEEMIGAEYVKKLNEKVNQAMISYQTLACDKFLCCLSDEGLYVSQCFSSRLSNTVLRKRIKKFNGVFEEVKQFQSSWEVTDLKLRDELRRLMLGKLLPAYNSFLIMCRRHMDNGKQRCMPYHQEIRIEYSADDLEGVLGNLFISSSASEVPRESFHLGGGHMEPLPEV